MVSALHALINKKTPLSLSPERATRQPAESLLQAPTRCGCCICQVAIFAFQRQEALWRHAAAWLRGRKQPAHEGIRKQGQEHCAARLRCKACLHSTSTPGLFHPLLTLQPSQGPLQGVAPELDG